MTAFDYARSRKTAERLIARFGQAVALRRTVNIGPDWDPIFEERQYDCTAAVLEYMDSEIDGSLILAGDKKVFLSTEGIEAIPGVADKLIINGDSHSIMMIKPLSPAGMVVFWEVQCRR